MKEEVVLSVVYWFFAGCFIVPPNEFVSAGFTIQCIFSKLLGSEELFFIYYHVKRSSITLFLHSSLFLGHYLLLGFYVPQLNLYIPWKAGLWGQVYLLYSLVLPLFTATVVFYWSRNKWANHPIAKSCKSHSGSSSWQAVASSINVEFRRVDKFVSGCHGRRLYVTDSWLLQTSTYRVHLAHQQDVHLTLLSAAELDTTQEGGISAQYLTLTVSSVNPGVKDFNIRFNSADYAELKDKLQRPVRNARDIVVHQTLSERFITAFTEQVQHNPPFRPPQGMEVEACIGCMQQQADVKLVRHCAETSECVQCYCRPMWCCSCTARWFASRQDQSEPGRWMSSSSPCPTCRARFCMLDVCAVR